MRALMIPSGIPDFLTRTRLFGAGPVALQGMGNDMVHRVNVVVE